MSKLQNNSSKKSAGNYDDQLAYLVDAIQTADAIVIGAGSGLSTADGLEYAGERFERYFSDFKEAYPITNIYSGGFYKFKTPEEKWAWWSRQVLYNRYEHPIGAVYNNLFKILQDKNHFVITTNVDHKFQLAGFDLQRLFCVQGDYGAFQCQTPCQQKTYDNEAIIREMVAQQENMRIPSALIPHCPNCGAPMALHLRSGHNFVEDRAWQASQVRYKNFLHNHSDDKILFWELGVGLNTPSIIKYPFWRMTAARPEALFACVNKGEVLCPREIVDQLICLDADIAEVLADVQAALN